MKCRICGKNVNDKDICEECDKNIKEESTTKKEVLTIKRKHLLKYEFLRYFYLYIIFILAGAMTEKSSGMIVCLIILLLLVGFLLFWNKRISRATTCKFYSKKIDFKCNFWIIDRHREILYKNLDSINKEQTFLQKIFNLGNIYIYAKKGNLLTTGIEIKNVPNFKETYEKINQIIEDKKK